jgi:hypothetical protein
VSSGTPLRRTLEESPCGEPLRRALEENPEEVRLKVRTPKFGF